MANNPMNFSGILLSSYISNSHSNILSQFCLLSITSQISQAHNLIEGAFALDDSGVRIYSRIYSGYSAPGSRIAEMEIQVFRNENSSQINAHSRCSNYIYTGLIPNKRALSVKRCAMAEKIGQEHLLFKYTEKLAI